MKSKDKPPRTERVIARELAASKRENRILQRQVARLQRENEKLREEPTEESPVQPETTAVGRVEPADCSCGKMAKSLKLPSGKTRYICDCGKRWLDSISI